LTSTWPSPRTVVCAHTCTPLVCPALREGVVGWGWRAAVLRDAWGSGLHVVVRVEWEAGLH
jgi:hypothetical protein